MAEIVRRVIGEWRPAQGVVHLQLGFDQADQAHDVLIAPSDMRVLATMLLALAQEVGRLPAADENAPRSLMPLAVDSIGVGEDAEGNTVLELEVGAVALAFTLPAVAGATLGRSLLAASVGQNERAN